MILDPSEPLFIVGDLNMDLFSNKGNDLKDFLLNNQLKNHVEQHTRVSRNFYEKKNKYVTSKTLIDVVLHNQNRVVKTEVIGCPFSDHSFVISALDFKPPKPVLFQTTGRSLSEKNLMLIGELVNNLNSSFVINKEDDINMVWSDYKSKITQILDTVAPLKSFKQRPVELAPWDDDELSEKRKTRDYSFFKYKNSNNLDDELNFKRLKSEYQSLNRQKMIDYFASKGIKDFKSNKLYWEFYSFSIKIKSCVDDDLLPSVFVDSETNDKYADPEKIGNVFNMFFTSLSSTSLASEAESDNYIDDTFSYLKGQNRIRLKTDCFKFVHTTEKIVEKLILNLNATSGAGFSGIPSKLIKYSCNAFVPFLTTLFNHCIDIGKLPAEWKSAIVTPLYKNKGNMDDFNNYRGISVLPPIAKIF